MGRPQQRGQSPEANGELYGQIVQTPAQFAALGNGLLGFASPVPTPARALGESPGQLRRIVDGAEGFGSGLFTGIVDLNSALNQPIRILTPAEFYDTQTDTIDNRK